LPDPQTTKTNNANKAGPTGYFSSDGFCKIKSSDYIHGFNETLLKLLNIKIMPSGKQPRTQTS
jgi:hypothetical protein